MLLKSVGYHLGAIELFEDRGVISKHGKAYYGSLGDVAWVHLLNRVSIFWK